MPRRPLVWKLFPAYYAVALLCVLLFVVYVSGLIKTVYHGEVERGLVVRTMLIKRDLERSPIALSSPALTATVADLAKTSSARLTVIDPSGRVVADSSRDPRSMENHADRPEFRQALSGNTGTSKRISPTLGFTMVYVAVPIERDGKTVAVLRSSLAASALESAPAVTYRRMVTGAFLISLLAVVFSLLAVKVISEPLRRMKQSAEQFANGDFGSRVPMSDTKEFADLGNTLNRMASQLDRQVRTITRQANEQQAILSSMKEAVVAVDNDERVLILNPAAENLLDITLNAIRGKTIQEAIRNPDLQRFFENIHEGASALADEIVFRGREERTMQAVGSALMDLDGRRIGLLVVLNDITELRRLESIRKDFVANVSHELKTPITSIKGFVETLRDGTVEDPAQRREFLDIVARQADRLHAIIDDLLALSSVEQRAETAGVPTEWTALQSVLQAAVVDCWQKASDTGAELSIDCPEDIHAFINAPLLEQAVSNLVDNAIKYSSGGKVVIRARREGNEVAIHVSDTGPGIEPEHIPRLFERFYRVDKARSRKQGGTGLGLAIVKHIVQAHNGRIDVRSTPGKGSTFSVYVPVSQIEHREGNAPVTAADS